MKFYKFIGIGCIIMFKKLNQYETLRWDDIILIIHKYEE